MRRGIRVGAIVALLLCVLARAAPAASDFEFLWSGTTGTGTPGGAEITAAPGDVLTLDVLINVDSAGLVFAGISLDFSTEALTNPAIVQCPTGCQGMNPFPAIVLPGSIHHIRVSDPPTPGPTTILLASIDFTATGASGTVDPKFIFEVDGVIDGNFEVDLSPPATGASVVGVPTVPALPGPAAPLFLVLGLVVSARLAWRRRKALPPGRRH